ncbi:MAG: metallophosphoesterase family protein [Planctomycetota bacterium]|nr:metallophosphoesterase family protein [Planctomycetota bacterium]
MNTNDSPTDANSENAQNQDAGRTLVIGDIHGCASALELLLQEIALEPADTLVFLGDYVDRGSNSRGVLDIILKLMETHHIVPLLGNHEIMMLDAVNETVMRDLWLHFGGQQTIESYGGKFENIPDEHLKFLRNCVRYYETDDHLFVHANYLPGKPLDEQEDQVLYWTHLLDFRPGPHCSGKRVIVGHTPQTNGNILDFGHMVCIDTYCFGGGKLTAMDVQSNEIWQTSEKP